MRRNERELDMAILGACGKPIILTKLMYATNINVSVISKRLKALSDKGLLTIGYLSKGKHHNCLNPTSRKYARRSYEVTEKGRKIISLYNQFLQAFNSA